MFPYPPEPGDGLDFTFKISNDRTKLKVYVRNVSGRRASILDPVVNPMEQEFKLLKLTHNKAVSGIIYCYPYADLTESLQIENKDVAEVSTGFSFLGNKPGIYSGKVTFYNPKSKHHWRPADVPVQHVEMRSVRFLVRVYPSGKYKLLKVIDKSAKVLF